MLRARNGSQSRAGGCLERPAVPDSGVKLLRMGRQIGHGDPTRPAFGLCAPTALLPLWFSVHRCAGLPRRAVSPLAGAVQRRGHTADINQPLAPITPTTP